MSVVSAFTYRRDSRIRHSRALQWGAELAIAGMNSDAGTRSGR
jgi:hypothetical protein